MSEPEAELQSWDHTDPHNPQPLIYPRCPTCQVPHVYRRFLSFGTGKYVWAWARDCKHKSVKPEFAGDTDRIPTTNP